MDGFRRRFRLFRNRTRGGKRWPDRSLAYPITDFASDLYVRTDAGCSIDFRRPSYGRGAVDAMLAVQLPDRPPPARSYEHRHAATGDHPDRSIGTSRGLR